MANEINEARNLTKDARYVQQNFDAKVGTAETVIKDLAYRDIPTVGAVATGVPLLLGALAHMAGDAETQKCLFLAGALSMSFFGTLNYLAIEATDKLPKMVKEMTRKKLDKIIDKAHGILAKIKTSPEMQKDVAELDELSTELKSIRLDSLDSVYPWSKTATQKPEEAREI